MTAPVFPPGRYGRRRFPHRTRRWVVPLVTAAAVVLGLAVALFAWAGTSAGRPQGVVTAFAANSPDEVSVTLEVAGGDGDARCLLEAKARDGGVVGSAEVTVPAAGRRGVFTIRTKGQVVAVDVASCR